MQWFKLWWARCLGRPANTSQPMGERQQAQALIRAIDRGGLPLNPARVNHIARSLGLEVSARAPMAETVERIRQALARGG
jgi:hypothetical protein